MTTIHGPDFLALQVPDLDRAAAFYSEVVGLQRAPQSPPGAVLFQTSPVPFAVRVAQGPLGDAPLGHGVALWFRCDSAPELYARLKAHGVELLDEPAPGPFGMTFRFKDLDGYIITMHDKA